MSFVYDANGAIPTTGAAAVRRLKTALVAAGWTVTSSGTGTSGTGSGSYSSSSDLLTTDALMANTQAWFVIRDPALQRQWAFQRCTANYSWRIKYSAAAGFSGGSPSAGVTPTATDQQFPNQSSPGTDASPTGTTLLGTTDGNYRIWIVAGDGTIGYGWWFACNTQSLTTIQACWFQDVLKAGTYPSADLDPCVQYLAAALVTTAYLSANASAPQAWLDYGGGSAAYQRVVIADVTDNSGTIIFPNAVAVNPASNNDTALDCLYMRGSSQSGTTGFKGVGSLFQLQGIARAVGTPYQYLVAYDRASFGILIVPSNALMTL